MRLNRFKIHVKEQNDNVISEIEKSLAFIPFMNIISIHFYNAHRFLITCTPGVSFLHES